MELKAFRSFLQDLNRGSSYLLIAFLFYTSVVIFIMTGREVIGGDSPATAYLPVSVLEYGTLRLDPFVNRNPFFDLDRKPHYVVESNGHYYSKFSPLTSLMVTPLYAFDFLLFGPPGDCIECNATRYIRLSRLSASLLEACVVVVVFFILRYRTSQSLAFLLSLGYAFGTYSWASATNTLTVQSTGELFVALSLLAVLRTGALDERHRGLWIAVTFGCLSLAGAVRPQLAVVVGLMGAYLSWWAFKHQWLKLWHFLPAVIVVMLFFSYNIWAFDSPFMTGYEEEALTGWDTPFIFGFSGILFSPAHGLLLYSPLLLLGVLAGLWLLIRWVWFIASSKLSLSLRSYRLESLLSVAALSYLVIMSHWWAWHGGAAYNQRMLQEIHPLLIFLLTSVIRRFGLNQRGTYLLLGMASLWGAGQNLVRLTFYDQHLQWLEVYHPEIVWSWADVEILKYIRWHGLQSVIVNSSLTLARCLLIAVPALFLLGRLLSKPRFRSAKKEGL